MRSSRRFTYCLPALVGFSMLWPASGAQGQYFRDDFEDGSATDGSPVTWAPEAPPWPVGQQRVEDGSLILTPAREAFPSPNWYETDWEVQQDMPIDIVVRTSVRTLDRGAAIKAPSVNPLGNRNNKA